MGESRGARTDVFTLETSERTWGNGMKLGWGIFRFDIKKKFFTKEGVWALEQAPQTSGHSTKSDRA